MTASGYKFKEVDKIIFGMISPQEVEKSSAVKVVTAELYDKEGYPVDGGLMDIRLGVIDPGLRCKTCGSKLKECIGHFGHIELARPVIHVSYAAKIYETIKAICRECNRLLIDEETATKYRTLYQKFRKEKNFEYVRKLTKLVIGKTKLLKKCPHCNAKQIAIKIEKPTTFMEGDKRLSPIEIRARFAKIQDKDLELLGMDPAHARPEWMILTLLPIPPVTMRPSITLETGERSEDDLTHKLGDIVRINQRLFENINAGAPEIIVEDLWDLLQYHVTTYFDNTITQIPPARHRSGQALKTLTERIKSKEGRFRHNLAGKRVNFAARTVISPDPEIEFNEVGIPKSVAMELTIPERVTEWNKEWLLSLVKNGPKEYPGANYVIATDGKKRKITKETQEQLIAELKEGYVVERQVIDGDIALFNRQPSLHRMSIMCHKVKVLPGRSFRLNPSVCVAPDTNVSLTTGIQRPIDELRNCWKESELQTYDWKKKAVRSTKIKKFWGLKPEEYGTKCYEIVTKETRRRIVATADHPFYTNKGVKGAGNIKRDDKVVVNPHDSPSYQEKERQIMKESDIIKHAPKKTYLKHTLKVLRNLKLNEMNLIDQRLMIVARLLGHVFGDGTCILKDHVARLIYRGHVEDLERIQQDIKNLGFTPEKIYTKTNEGIIRTVGGKELRVYGSGNEFEIRHKPLVILLKALGAPNGDKVTKKYSVPLWIRNAPLYIQREFIAAYFGSELTTPAIRAKSKTNFRALTFKIAKVEKKDAYPLIRDLKKVLERFDVNISEMREEPGNWRKDGKSTTILECRISSNASMKNFFGKIGYIYANKKDYAARNAYQYLLLKEKAIKERKMKYQKLHALRKKGYTFKRIAEKLQMSVSMLENWVYRNKGASLGTSFPTFDQWVKENTRGLKNGLVWETIDKIKEKYCPFVYDVTTSAETHNFFANGFLTKNCNPYNADFDGDEMNLHIPQTEEARAEAEILMQVQTQIMTPKNGYNIIGCVEDAVTGNYLLTKKLVISREDAVELLTSIGVFNAKFDKEMIKGSEVVSKIFPEDFSFYGTAKQKDEQSNEVYLTIKKGKIVSGYIDDNSIGENNGELIREFYRKYGKDRTLILLGNLFKLGIKILAKYGFTTTIADTDIPREALEKIDELVANAYRDVDALIKEYEAGKLEELPGKTLRETLEVKSLEILNKVRNKVGALASQHADENNPTIIMARSGAKGNILNFTQMSACVGQQALGGQRIQRGFKNRTLSLFKEWDLGPVAHGFVKSSFKKGLMPVEFFFHAMTGRDALMDTALRTPKSGYLYRRLANALQDLKIEYDGTVRNARKGIVQFKYGDDGIDVSKSEGGKISVQKAIADVLGQ